MKTNTPKPRGLVMVHTYSERDDSDKLQVEARSIRLWIYRMKIHLSCEYQ